jgi:hypothetical protein
MDVIGILAPIPSPSFQKGKNDFKLDPSAIQSGRKSVQFTANLVILRSMVIQMAFQLALPFQKTEPRFAPRDDEENAQILDFSKRYAI